MKKLIKVVGLTSLLVASAASAENAMCTFMLQTQTQTGMSLFFNAQPDWTKNYNAVQFVVTGPNGKTSYEQANLNYGIMSDAFSAPCANPQFSAEFVNVGTSMTSLKYQHAYKYNGPDYFAPGVLYTITFPSDNWS
jgi:hypothetical protein